MPKQLELEILAQPDNATCGPTCLHAVYRYFDDDLPLEQVIAETPMLKDGGTLAVLLGCHALRRGYRATIYTYNLKVFDPTWFDVVDSFHEPQPARGTNDRQIISIESQTTKVDLVERLQAEIRAKESPKLQAACRAYIDFIQLGGKMRMEDLKGGLIRRFLKRSIPILTGLSSTYLYHCQREHGPECEPDDVHGLPVGHFVVLCGYDKQQRTVQVADPYVPNPLGDEHYYEVGLDRLIGAILLGVLTYDANLLIIEPAKKRK
jgi:hypothetical protein